LGWLSYHGLFIVAGSPRGVRRSCTCFALGILPLVLLPFANFTVMEYTKQVNFRGSCHQAMQPYLDDMLKPGRQSLAALHFQDRFAPTQAGTECYSFHADYGVHGTLVAKLGGLHDGFSYMSSAI
jgi:hypothetical protein